VALQAFFGVGRWGESVAAVRVFVTEFARRALGTVDVLVVAFLAREVPADFVVTLAPMV
jgi:hypothetical protein